jgi:hypothetical protein
LTLVAAVAAAQRVAEPAQRVAERVTEAAVEPAKHANWLEARPMVTGTYGVDGLSSTGVCAGADGSGDVTVDIAAHTATLSGRLHLARDGD